MLIIWVHRVDMRLDIIRVMRVLHDLGRLSGRRGQPREWCMVGLAARMSPGISRAIPATTATVSLRFILPLPSLLSSSLGRRGDPRTCQRRIHVSRRFALCPPGAICGLIQSPQSGESLDQLSLTTRGRHLESLIVAFIYSRHDSCTVQRFGGGGWAQIVFILSFVDGVQMGIGEGPSAVMLQ